MRPLLAKKSRGIFHLSEKKGPPPGKWHPWQSDKVRFYIIEGFEGRSDLEADPPKKKADPKSFRHRDRVVFRGGACALRVRAVALDGPGAY